MKTPSQLNSGLVLLCCSGLLACYPTLAAPPVAPATVPPSSMTSSALPTNPYWPMANRSVNAVLQLNDEQLAGSNATTNLFWLSWALTSPHRQPGDGKEVSEKCLKLADTIAASYTTHKPEDNFTGGGFWNYLPLLESLRMLDDVPEIDAAREAQWKAAVLPHIEHEYQTNGQATGANWATSSAGQYPNSDAQYLAFIYAAYLLYKDENYKTSASEFVAYMDKKLRAPGAWLYYRDSTPIPLYHGFEVMFMGRYYQLSRDPAAAEQIRRTKDFYPTTYAPEDTVEYTSSPWWKQMWNATGGPYHAPEMVSWLTGDPQNRWFADLRAQRYFQHYWIAYCGEAWDEAQKSADKKLLPQPFPENYIGLNASIDGLRGRSGRFSWTGSRGKNTIGFGGVMLADSALPQGYDAYLQFAHLGITVPGKEGQDYYNSLRLIGDPAAFPTTGAAYVNSNFGALAVSYIPRLQTRPDKAYDDWKVTELWLFTGKGVVASFQATALKENPGTLPQGLMRFGPLARPHALTGNKFFVGSLQGQIVQSDFPKIEMLDGTGDEHVKERRIEVRQTLDATVGGINIAKGQTFGYSALFSPQANLPVEVKRESDNALQVKLDGFTYELHYNGAGQLSGTRQ